MMELETFKKEKLETEGAQKTAEEQLEVMRKDFEEKVSHCVFVGAFASCRKSAVLLAKLKRFFCLSYRLYKLLFLIFSTPLTLYKYNYQLNFHRKVDKRPRLPGGVATHQLLDYYCCRSTNLPETPISFVVGPSPIAKQMAWSGFQLSVVKQLP